MKETLRRWIFICRSTPPHFHSYVLINVVTATHLECLWCIVLLLEESEQPPHTFTEACACACFVQLCKLSSSGNPLSVRNPRYTALSLQCFADYRNGWRIRMLRASEFRTVTCVTIAIRFDATSPVFYTLMIPPRKPPYVPFRYSTYINS